MSRIREQVRCFKRLLHLCLDVEAFALELDFWKLVSDYVKPQNRTGGMTFLMGE
jgi:hypothetical protein